MAQSHSDFNDDKIKTDYVEMLDKEQVKHESFDLSFYVTNLTEAHDTQLQKILNVFFFSLKVNCIKNFLILNMQFS